MFETDGSVCDDGGLDKYVRSRRSSGGLDRSPSKDTTVKEIQRTRSSQHELTLICREIDMLASLRHECIVELREYFVCPVGSRIHLVLELLPGGDLKDNLSWRCARGHALPDGSRDRECGHTRMQGQFGWRRSIQPVVVPLSSVREPFSA